MMQRLHTHILGLGAICGLQSRPLAEVLLHTLPCPAQVNSKGYILAEYSSTYVKASTACHLIKHDARCRNTKAELDPLYNFVSGGAGHKHIVLATHTGIIVVADESNCAAALQSKVNTPRAILGQQSSVEMCGCGYDPKMQRTRDAPLIPRQQSKQMQVGWPPICINSDVWLDTQARDSLAMADGAGVEVSCGSNFTVVYRPNTRNIVAFGCDSHGQLGVGRVHGSMRSERIEVWDAQAAWWPSPRSTISGITCGFNHAIAHLSSGELYAFGDNTSGALGIGSTNPSAWPTPITFFSTHKLRVRKVACGKGFTLFLTDQGCVYGCGSAYEGQLPRHCATPMVLPIARYLVHDSKNKECNGMMSRKKMLRIKDIACVGSMAVYVNTNDEIFVQGSFTDYGVYIPAPRLQTVSQVAAIDAMQAVVNGGADGMRAHVTDGFVIDELIAGPSSLLVRYRNGCIAGLGANTEGQLQYKIRVLADDGRVNVAPAFALHALLPVLCPLPYHWQNCSAKLSRIRVISGMGFTLILDKDEMYALKTKNDIVKLPSVIP